MANAAATLQALNMLLSSQERRQQADIQASLGGMELALKERQAEDLARHRRATEFMQAGQLAESQLMGMESRKASSIQREAAQQKIMVQNLETIQAGLDDTAVELSNNIWMSMGLDRLYDQFAPTGGRDIEATHHDALVKYLSGDKVSFKISDAQDISDMILGYGSMQKKNPTIMMKFAQEFSTKMEIDPKKPTKHHHFLKAAANAGMIVDIDAVQGDKGKAREFTNAYHMLDKARKLREYRAYIRKEESELTYQAKKGESVDYEREIRYEFQAPEKLAGLTALAEDISDDKQTAFNPNRPVFASSYGAGDEIEAADAVQKIDDARDTGDYEYGEDYASLMSGYVGYDPVLDDKGDVTGYDYSKPAVQRQQSVSGGTGAFDFGWTQADLKGSEQSLYDTLDEHRENITKEIRDARGEINRLQSEGVTIAARSTLTSLAEDPSQARGRDVDLWRETERLRMLNEEQMKLNQTVMQTTTGQWDSWTRAFPWTDASSAYGLRTTLPGSMLTDTERERRYSKYEEGLKYKPSKGMIGPMDGEKMRFFQNSPGATLEDYLGRPIASAIVPTDPIVDKQLGEKSYLEKQWDMNVAGRSAGEIFMGGIENMGRGLYQTGEILGNLTPKFYKP